MLAMLPLLWYYCFCNSRLRHILTKWPKGCFFFTIFVHNSSFVLIDKITEETKLFSFIFDNWYYLANFSKMGKFEAKLFHKMRCVLRSFFEWLLQWIYFANKSVLLTLKCLRFLKDTQKITVYKFAFEDLFWQSNSNASHEMKKN